MKDKVLRHVGGWFKGNSQEFLYAGQRLGALIVVWLAWSNFPGLPQVELWQMMAVVWGWRIILMAVDTWMLNLGIKFFALPYALFLAWGTVLPKFWIARPEMGFNEIWLGYIAIYAIATVLSQVLNPKQVL